MRALLRKLLGQEANNFYDMPLVLSPDERREVKVALNTLYGQLTKDGYPEDHPRKETIADVIIRLDNWEYR